MHPKLKAIRDTIVAEKWWLLGPIIALGVVLLLIVLLGGGAGSQGFNYF